MSHKRLALAAALLTAGSCQKEKTDPADQLPPATQTGTNTFGCLVNGQVWTPQGNDGTSNYSVSYDPTYKKGTLNVVAYRISGGNADQQTIGFYSDSVQGVGTYQIIDKGRHQAGVVNRRTGCQYYSQDAGTFCRGGFIVTRLDRQAGIVSGTFWFTLYKPGCDTVKVTQGRFDKKL